MPTHVRNNPLIFAGRVLQGPNPQLDGITLYSSKNNPDVTKQKGKLLIYDLWQNGTNSAHRMNVVNT